MSNLNLWGTVNAGPFRFAKASEGAASQPRVRFFLPDNGRGDMSTRRDPRLVIYKLSEGVPNV